MLSNDRFWVQTKKLGGKEHHKDVKTRWDYGLVTQYSLATWIVALRDRDNLFNRASLTRYRFRDHFQTDRWAHDSMSHFCQVVSIPKHLDCFRTLLIIQKVGIGTISTSCRTNLSWIVTRISINQDWLLQHPESILAGPDDPIGCIPSLGSQLHRWSSFYRSFSPIWL